MYIRAGEFDPTASLEVRTEQLQKIHEKEGLPLIHDTTVAEKMTSKWRKDRYITRNKVTIKGDMSTKDFRDLYKEQFQRCMFTGMRLELDTSKLMAFSQDCINSDISYDMGNVFCGDRGGSGGP